MIEGKARRDMVAAEDDCNEDKQGCRDPSGDWRLRRGMAGQVRLGSVGEARQGSSLLDEAPVVMSPGMELTTEKGKPCRQGPPYQAASHTK